MLLVEVPPARADQQRRDVIVERVLASVGALVGDRPIDRVDQVGLAGDLVAPGGGVRVLEVGHESTCPRVERVDDQLAVGRARDLDPAIGIVRAWRGDAPLARAHLRRFGQEVERAPVAQDLVALAARREQLAATVLESSIELGQEVDRVLAEDLAAQALVEAGGGDLSRAHLGARVCTWTAIGDRGHPGRGRRQTSPIRHPRNPDKTHARALSGGILAICAAVVVVWVWPGVVAGPARPKPAPDTLAPGLSRRAIPASPRWRRYDEAPPQAVVRPVRVLAVMGDVTQPQALTSSGSGATTTLTYSRAGTPPSLVLDYGQEVGGTPTFDVAGRSVTTISATFSEKLANLGQDGA